MSYCDHISTLPEDDPNRHYHDSEYGFPLYDDRELFGRLLLEINQAGLSWTLMLRKAAAFRAAYAGFNIAAVAAFGEADRARLLADAGIVRNRLKIHAAIHNAAVILDLQRQHGSFRAWLDAHHPQTLPEWVKLFKRTFKFTGPEITREFLMSTGYLKGAHRPSCPVYARVEAANPPWLQAERAQQSIRTGQA